MPAPLHQDATAYLKQQGLPITTNSLNRTMGLLQQQPNLRPSYAGQSVVDIDPDTMRPIEGKTLPPLNNGVRDITEYDEEGNIAGTFGDAFKSARKALGAGKTFTWRGKKYTTDYKEEVDPRQVSSNNTSGETDKFGDDDSLQDPINSEAVDDIQQGLAEEDNQFAEMDEKKKNTKRVSAGRGGYIEQEMSPEEIADRDMNSMLDMMIGGGAAAAAGGAAVAAARGNKEPVSYRNDVNDPRYKGIGSSPDLAGGFEAEKPAVNNADEMSEMFKDMFPDENKAFLSEVAKGGDQYLPDEVEAAKAALEGNKMKVRNHEKRIPSGKNTAKLKSILKAFM